MINIQIASDIHIDYKNNKIYNDASNYLEIPTKNDKNDISILVLCGDIGSLYKIEQLENFLFQVSRRYNFIFYIFGNNEFYYEKEYPYKLSYEKLIERGKNISTRIKNLYILDNESILIEDYIFVGCTLWSNIKGRLPKYFKIIDFTEIKYKNLFLKDIDYIKQSIYYSKKNNKKLIVMTHYPPIFNKKNEGKNRNDLYSNNLYNLIYDSNILYWIHGHNHISECFKINNTLVISNQKGKKETDDNKYNRNLTIKL